MPTKDQLINPQTMQMGLNAIQAVTSFCQTSSSERTTRHYNKCQETIRLAEEETKRFIEACDVQKEDIRVNAENIRVNAQKEILLELIQLSRHVFDVKISALRDNQDKFRIMMQNQIDLISSQIKEYDAKLNRGKFDDNQEKAFIIYRLRELKDEKAELNKSLDLAMNKIDEMIYNLEISDTLKQIKDSNQKLLR